MRLRHGHRLWRMFTRKRLNLRQLCIGDKYDGRADVAPFQRSEFTLERMVGEWQYRGRGITLSPSS